VSIFIRQPAQHNALFPATIEGVYSLADVDSGGCDPDAEKPTDKEAGPAGQAAAAATAQAAGVQIEVHISLPTPALKPPVTVNPTSPTSGTWSCTRPANLGAGAYTITAILVLPSGRDTKLNIRV
jgi:hypothetical protein